MSELAQLLGRPYNTVVWMLRTGTLADFGIIAYKDTYRWWFKVPPSLLE